MSGNVRMGLVRGFTTIFVVAIYASGGAWGQTASYSLGTQANMLDADFYSGKAGPGSATVEAPSGRGILNIGVNPAGTKALFWGINFGTFQQGLFLVNIGDPSSWQRVSADQSFFYYNIVWCADNIHAFVGTGLLFNTNSKVLTVGHEVIPGYSFNASSITRKPSDNWMVGGQLTGQGNVPAYPVLSNGQGDSGRPYRDLTNLTVGPSDQLILPWISRDGDLLLFSIVDASGTPDVANIYRLAGVNDILNGITSPPTSLADPRIVEIRASASTNYVSTPSLSFDGAIVFWSEDYNNVFDAQNFFASLAAADFDVSLSNSDGTGYVQFPEAGSQGVVVPFPTGNRLTYQNQYNSYAITLVVENDIDAETDVIAGEGTNSTVVNGNPVVVPFILTNSAVATTTPVTVADASGTVISLPTDQVINFPANTPPGISIFTPVDPVAPVQLPDPQTSIPVKRVFGPAGTEFFPPITVTITYTDEEVANIQDESLMIPYLYNQGLGVFEPLCAEGDTPCLAGITVDTVNNTLSFVTDHFSTYGIGGRGIPMAPVRDWTLYFVSFILATMSFTVLVARGRKRARK